MTVIVGLFSLEKRRLKNVKNWLKFFRVTKGFSLSEKQNKKVKGLLMKLKKFKKSRTMPKDIKGGTLCYFL